MGVDPEIGAGSMGRAAGLRWGGATARAVLRVRRKVRDGEEGVRGTGEVTGAARMRRWANHIL